MYKNPSDPRVFVPKRPGGGLTLNFAHPAAWWVLIGMTIIPIVVVVIAVIAALA
jgi:uncharacterized membrane protein